MTEKIIPDGYKLVSVKGLDELVYWLDRCKDKGHLENCADLIEPFEAFEYRNVSEEAVIAAHEAKAAPASTQDEPFGYFRAEPFGWTDCAATDEGAIALYERPAAPAVPQGWQVERKSDYRIRVQSPSGDAWSFENVDDRGSSILFVYQMLDAMLAATPAAPSQEPVTDEWVCKMARRYAGTIVDRHGHNAFLFTLAELLAFIATLRGKEALR